MTLTVTLTDEEQANLAAQAEARGVTVDRLVHDVVHQVASKPMDVPKANDKRPRVRRVPMKDRSQEMKWIRDHRAEYAGRWVAVDGPRLIAVGDDPKTVLAEARAAGVPCPLLDHVLPPGPYWGGWS